MDDGKSSVQAGALLSTLHASMARCAKSWGIVADRREAVSLTADDAKTMADFFARAAADTTAIASLTGFTLLVVAPETLTETQPQQPGRTGLYAIDGGKA